MQASLEAEAKGKAEALRMKKKLEADINELEIALDHANKVIVFLIFILKLKVIIFLIFSEYLYTT